MNDVSGIITTYKRDSSIVEKAIQSMLDQTIALKEIVVVDDNPNDSEYCSGVEAVCKKYNNVKYLKQNGNKGACAARNLGIRNTTGAYIAFLDDDDTWFPQKIEKQLSTFMINPPKVGLVYCCGVLCNQETNEEMDYYNIKSFRERVSFNDLLEYDYIGSTSQPLIRRECFEKVGLFWEEQPARQDYEMWLRISKEFEIIGIPDKLFRHCIHDGEQISKGSLRSHLGYINIYKRYRKDFNNNLPAKEHILSMILATRSSIGLNEFYVYFLRIITVLQIKKGSRNKSKDSD